MGKSAFAVFAINEAAIFQVAQRESDRHPADVKTPAQLMFTGNRKRRWLRALQNFLRQRVYQSGACGGRALSGHSTFINDEFSLENQGKLHNI